MDRAAAVRGLAPLHPKSPFFPTHFPLPSCRIPSRPTPAPLGVPAAGPATYSPFCVHDHFGFQGFSFLRLHSIISQSFALIFSHTTGPGARQTSRATPLATARMRRTDEEITPIDERWSSTGSIPAGPDNTVPRAHSPQGPRHSGYRTLGSQVFSLLSAKNPALHTSGTNSSHALYCAKPHFPPFSVFQRNLNPGITSLHLFRTSYPLHQPLSHHLPFFF